MTPFSVWRYELAFSGRHCKSLQSNSKADQRHLDAPQKFVLFLPFTFLDYNAQKESEGSLNQNECQQAVDKVREYEVGDDISVVSVL